MSRQVGTSPPAIVLGGRANAISVARSLARLGVDVHVLNAPYEAVRFSRHVTWIRLDGDEGNPDAWGRFLLGPRSDHLRGAVLLACSDEAIDLMIDNADALSAKFVLEEGDPRLRRALLDKLTTYRQAAEANVPTPGYWFVETRSELEGMMDRFRFPLILKPLFSPDFAVFGRKYLKADDAKELVARFQEVTDRQIPFVIMEFVPGPDERLCSYYTYMDEDGTPLVHFTKRVLRRHPVNMGSATYHVTDWNPEAAELGMRFFRHVGLRGLGNIEFKYDTRDGLLKIIECNARFTASNEVVARSGVDLAVMTYKRLTGRPVTPITAYRRNLRLIFPIEDFRAFQTLRARGEMTAGRWISEVLRADHLPYFAWTDPIPSLFLAFAKTTGLRRRMLARAMPIKREQETQK